MMPLEVCKREGRPYKSYVRLSSPGEHGETGVLVHTVRVPEYLTATEAFEVGHALIEAARAILDNQA